MAQFATLNPEKLATLREIEVSGFLQIILMSGTEKLKCKKPHAEHEQREQKERLSFQRGVLVV